MPKNTLQDLRNHLFEMIEKLKDEDCESADIEKAKALAQLGGVIVDSAKLEVKAAEVLGLKPKDGFLQLEEYRDVPDSARPQLIDGRKPNGEAKRQ